MLQRIRRQSLFASEWFRLFKRFRGNLPQTIGTASGAQTMIDDVYDTTMRVKRRSISAYVQVQPRPSRALLVYRQACIQCCQRQMTLVIFCIRNFVLTSCNTFTRFYRENDRIQGGNKSIGVNGAIPQHRAIILSVGKNVAKMPKHRTVEE